MMDDNLHSVVVISFEPVDVFLSRRQSAYYVDLLPPPIGYGWHWYEFHMVN